ncbi:MULTISPECIES: hypothetical protein [Paenibacillus]|uniref:hypothetical protein n=1 Tax=Paenibacillus TaxID=44249 RepID=UPI0022B88AA7|nr:hypothetical protein [Paenibacillus caseinilyticus]MCZ8520154.1 hypothetical protein [Paenibacillus caseinilyticus]
MRRHMTPVEREMVGQSVTASTYWVWTEKAERIYPDRKAGTPVFEHHRKLAPQLWVHRGYVRESDSAYQLQLGLEA